METVAIAAHIFITLFLVGIIMLQSGKGADIGAVFGGASQTLFGGRGPATFLNKMTIIVSIIFFFTSIWLVKISQTKGTESVIGKVPAKVEELKTEPTKPVVEDKKQEESK